MALDVAQLSENQLYIRGSHLNDTGKLLNPEMIDKFKSKPKIEIDPDFGRVFSDKELIDQIKTTQDLLDILRVIRDESGNVGGALQSYSLAVLNSDRTVLATLDPFLKNAKIELATCRSIVHQLGHRIAECTSQEEDVKTNIGGLAYESWDSVEKQVIEVIARLSKNLSFIETELEKIKLNLKKKDVRS